MPAMTTEKVCCLQCQQPVNDEDHISDELTPSTKEVRVYCDHCNCTFIASFRLEGGVWSRVGRISRRVGRFLALRKCA